MTGKVTGVMVRWLVLVLAAGGGAGGRGERG